MVCRLALGCQTPTKGQWERVKRVLHYLNGTKDSHVEYGKAGESSVLETYVDTSYGVDPIRFRSITGYVICFRGGPILWRSHPQSTVTDSPNTAEYIGIYEVAVATMGIQNLLIELVLNPGTPKIHEDNDGVRILTMNGTGQKRARRLDIKHHFTQELRDEGLIQVVQLPSGDQPAGLLTKGLHTARSHEYLMEKLGVTISTYTALIKGVVLSRASST